MGVSLGFVGTVLWHAPGLFIASLTSLVALAGYLWIHRKTMDHLPMLIGLGAVGFAGLASTMITYDAFRWGGLNPALLLFLDSMLVFVLIARYHSHIKKYISTIAKITSILLLIAYGLLAVYGAFAWVENQ